MGTVLSLSASAQGNLQAPTVPDSSSPALSYHVTVISRSVQAVNYQHQTGASLIDFAGTPLLLSANGKAKVRSKRGTMEVEAEFGNLQSPTTFGSEYLTFVLPAILRSDRYC
jgi:hypothetical protein